VDELVTAILSVAPSANIKTFDSIAEACKHAKADMQTCLDGNENDKIIAFGSFFTVSNVMQYLKAYAAVNF
jgi:dihydrofolate synthase/folylpolyglutamate synthase